MGLTIWDTFSRFCYFMLWCGICTIHNHFTIIQIHPCRFENIESYGWKGKPSVQIHSSIQSSIHSFAQHPHANIFSYDLTISVIGWKQFWKEHICIYVVNKCFTNVRLLLWNLPSDHNNYNNLIQCNAIQSSAVQCSAMQCNTIPYNAKQRRHKHKHKHKTNTKHKYKTTQYNTI